MPSTLLKMPSKIKNFFLFLSEKFYFFIRKIVLVLRHQKRNRQKATERDIYTEREKEKRGRERWRERERERDRGQASKPPFHNSATTNLLYSTLLFMYRREGAAVHS